MILGIINHVMHLVYSVRSSKFKLPLFELRVDHPAREAFTTDTNAFQYAITLQLMQYKESIHLNWNKRIIF